MGRSTPPPIVVLPVVRPQSRGEAADSHPLEGEWRGLLELLLEGDAKESCRRVCRPDRQPFT